MFLEEEQFVLQILKGNKKGSKVVE